MSKEYTIVTVANKIPHEWYYTFHEFFKSLQGVQPLVLGVNPGEYGGLGSKPRLLHNAIKEKQIETPYIIFCDCFDIVFAVHPDRLFQKYVQFAADIVVSAEKNCFPATYKEQYDAITEDIGSPYRYLNSGMIVGKTDAIFAVLESMDAPNIPNDYWSAEQNCMINPNDQEYWQHEFLKQSAEIRLDHYQILCNTLHDVPLEELDFTMPRIYNTVIKSFPCSYHLNGGAKTGPCREPILKHLNLI